MKYIILLQQDNHNGVVRVLDSIPIRRISIHSFKFVISKQTNDDIIKLFKNEENKSTMPKFVFVYLVCIPYTHLYEA